MSRNRRPSPQTTAVLRALADEPSTRRYGYDLCRILGLKAGTVYPILMRLTERGLVSAVWEANAQQRRPARHLYRLTPAGAELVAEMERSEAPMILPDLATGAN